MRLNNQVRVLERAIAAVLPLGAPADRLLSAFFREARELGQRERATIAESVYALLRHLASTVAMARTRDARRLALATLLRWRGVPLDELGAVATVRERPWLEELARAPLPSDPATRADLPPWLWERLDRAYPAAERDAHIASFALSAALDIRVNPVMTDRDTVLATLASQGIDGAPTPFAPLGIRLVGKPALQQNALFERGAIEVQDEGSQIVCHLVAPTRHEMVADFCAGAGGKTLLLGALMRSHGRLYAFDVVDTRLRKLRTRVARAGLSNVQAVLIDSERDPRIRRLAGRFDRVLVDAPCSGTGTLRRNPDLKWRTAESALAELPVKQARILAAAATLVRPGGRLVYATCSLLPDENDAIADAFLASHPGFVELPSDAILQRQGIDIGGGTRLRLSTVRHGCDAFFAAAFERKAGA